MLAVTPSILLFCAFVRRSKYVSWSVLWKPSSECHHGRPIYSILWSSISAPPVVCCGSDQTLHINGRTCDLCHQKSEEQQIHSAKLCRFLFWHAVLFIYPVLLSSRCSSNIISRWLRTIQRGFCEFWICRSRAICCHAWWSGFNSRCFCFGCCWCSKPTDSLRLEKRHHGCCSTIRLRCNWSIAVLNIAFDGFDCCCYRFCKLLL